MKTRFRQWHGACRVGWLNVTPLTRRDYMHLNELFFCLRLSQEEEFRLAKRLSCIAVEIPTHTHPTFKNLYIQGSPATINEDVKFWSTLLLFCTNRNVPDESWDPVGTIEFSLMLPARWMKLRAIAKVQAAFRAMLGRRQVALLRASAAFAKAPHLAPA